MKDTMQDGVMILCEYTEMVDVGELKRHPKNPNVHPQEQIKMLARNIQELGFRAPIVISKNSGYITRGHGRLEAALYNGMKKVPVDYQEYADDGQEIADMLADNRLSELSYRDDDLLKDALDTLQEYDIDILLSGYDIDDFDDAIAEEQQEQEEEKPEVKFSEVLGEEHNYVVLYFDNEVDWLQAESLFDLKPVKSLSTRKDGKITKGRERIGVGRVLNGAKAIERIKEVIAE